MKKNRYPPEYHREANKRWYQKNKESVIKRTRQWAKDNPDKLKKIHENYHKRHPGKGRSDRIARIFGLTDKEYEQLLEKQNRVCAICKKQETRISSNGKRYSLAIDHCHKTGNIRGLLCKRCNKALGSLEDSPLLFMNAVKYLVKSNLNQKRKEEENNEQATN